MMTQKFHLYIIMFSTLSLIRLISWILSWLFSLLYFSYQYQWNWLPAKFSRCWVELNIYRPSPPLDNIRVMMIVWRLRGNIIRTALCWVVWQCSQSAVHSCEQFLQVQQIGLSHWDPYAMHRGGCLELYYCNMVEWSWWDWSLICQTN